MKHVADNALATWFAPRWTWRSVVLAGTVTLGVFVLLPGLERLSTPPGMPASVRTVSTVNLPPPPSRLPEPLKPQPPRHQAPVPTPQMEPLRHGLAPLQASLDLGTALGGITGDFGVNFGDPVAFKTVADSVFELRDLDTDPRPLARREPLYPHVARMRDIEGFVMVVFVVTVEGRVRDIGIVASQPAGVFDQAVIDAVSRWRFEPGARQGETVAVRVRQRLVFQLE